MFHAVYLPFVCNNLGPISITLQKGITVWHLIGTGSRTERQSSDKFAGLREFQFAWKNSETNKTTINFFDKIRGK